MSLILRTIFRDEFATDPNQDPLNPINWTADLDVNYNGALQVLSGACGADAAAISNQGQALEWWNGTSPDDCFVQFKIGNLEKVNSSQLRTFYRCNSDANGYKTGGYQAAISATTGNVNIESRGTGGSEVGGIGGLTISSGDVFIFAVVGTTHYIYQNGIFLKSLIDSKYLVGGLGTVGIMAQPAANFSDATFSDFRTGHVKSVTLGQDGIFAGLLILP